MLIPIALPSLIPDNDFILIGIFGGNLLSESVTPLYASVVIKGVVAYGSSDVLLK